jgi:hypothetical protein
MFQIICATIFTVIAFYIFAYYMRCIYRTRKAKNWPVVVGKINHQELKVEESPDGDMYKMVIKYSYIIDDQSYSSENISFGGDFSSTDKCLSELVQMQFVGKTEVEVYYNPLENNESVLIVDIQNFHLFFILFSLVGLSFSISFLAL